MASAVEPVPGGEVLLAGELGRAVGREGLARIVLAGRPRALAVHGAAGGGEDHSRAVPPRGLEHAHGADDVHVGVELGPLDGGADVGLCGEVEDDLGARLVEGGVRVRADVAVVQARRAVQVLARPGGEVVEHVYLVAAGEQRIDEVGADEASPACHQRPHSPVS